MTEPIEMTAAQMRDAFPELFKLAQALRAQGGDVRLHSFRIVRDGQFVPVRMKAEAHAKSD